MFNKVVLISAIMILGGCTTISSARPVSGYQYSSIPSGKVDSYFGYNAKSVCSRMNRYKRDIDFNRLNQTFSRYNSYGSYNNRNSQSMRPSTYNRYNRNSWSSLFRGHYDTYYSRGYDVRKYVSYMDRVGHFLDRYKSYSNTSDYKIVKRCYRSNSW